MWVNGGRAVIAAWLNARQRSPVGVGMNSEGWIVNRVEQSNGLGIAPYKVIPYFDPFQWDWHYAECAFQIIYYTHWRMVQQTCQVSRNFRESPEMACDLQVSRNCKENSRNWGNLSEKLFFRKKSWLLLYLSEMCVSTHEYHWMWGKELTSLICCYYPPPPPNPITKAFLDPGKILPYYPPSSRRLSGTPEKFCYYPPPTESRRLLEITEKTQETQQPQLGSSGTMCGVLDIHLVRPLLWCYVKVYWADTLALKKAQENKLAVAEMIILRSMRGVTKLDRVRNEIFLSGRTKIEEISRKDQERRLKLYGHMVQREE